MKPRSRAPLLAFQVVAALWSASAAMAAPELAALVTGPPVVVLDRGVPFSGGPATPDAPARAWRDVGGKVHLVAADPRNRALSGPGLHALSPDCPSRFQGQGDADPAALDDLVWLAATWTDDGRTVEALGHVEYQGHRHPRRCPAMRYLPCWRKAVIALRSSDGGRRFERAAPDPAVAALPYPYASTLGAPSGYFSPSNVVALDDGRRAVFVFAEAAGRQRRGPCLLVTRDTADPAAWRAPRVGNEREDRLDDKHGGGCVPVHGPGGTVTSIVRHRATGLWVALVAGRRTPPGASAPRVGVWYLTSPDLHGWSGPRLLLEAPVMFAHGCHDSEAVAYPALLDPDAPGRNFDTVGDDADLWLVRFAVEKGCRLSRARDLLRLRVSFV